MYIDYDRVYRLHAKLLAAIERLTQRGDNVELIVALQSDLLFLRFIEQKIQKDMMLDDDDITELEVVEDQFS